LKYVFELSWVLGERKKKIHNGLDEGKGRETRGKA